jgi:nucleoid DNA-binding protein
MSIKYRPVKFILNYREEKPQVWKAQKLTFPVIVEDALIEYIANSAAIPKSTVKACTLAIAEAIIYFVINGHYVTFDSFGSFYLKMNVKTTRSLKECTIETIKRLTIGFTANTQLSNIMNKTKVEKVKTLTT